VIQKPSWAGWVGTLTGGADVTLELPGVPLLTLIIRITTMIAKTKKPTNNKGQSKPANGISGLEFMKFWSQQTL
jgi:hypothetical protein